MIPANNLGCVPSSAKSCGKLDKKTGYTAFDDCAGKMGSAAK
jgi:hypothetical protein